MDKLDYIKTKNFMGMELRPKFDPQHHLNPSNKSSKRLLCSKDLIQKVKRQLKEWKKISTYHILIFDNNFKFTPGAWAT